MALEIERRFLLKNTEWKKFITKRVLIEQGYLSNDLEGWIIRLRFNGKNFKITLKKHIRNFTNFEFEYEIPVNDGEKIMSTITNTVKKERFYLEVEKKTWIIDCFKEKNFPLEVAEIELNKETEELSLPKFLSQEITGIKNYSNFSLANYPFSQWENNNLEILKKS